MPACPICASSQTVKNGRIHNGKQRFKCHDCGRQFIEHSTKKVISPATRELIDRLLLERISLAGIARAAQVSEQWLAFLCQSKICPGISPSASDTEKKGSLTMQCDELWRQQSGGIIPSDFALSFVNHKGNKQWVWLALDSDTREIVGVHIGARNESSARQLWNSLPPFYRQCAVAYTDFWAAYAAVLPSYRHRAVDKETGNGELH